jgi:hypothetical protein
VKNGKGRRCVQTSALKNNLWHAHVMERKCCNTGNPKGWPEKQARGKTAAN